MVLFICALCGMNLFLRLNNCFLLRCNCSSYMGVAVVLQWTQIADDGDIWLRGSGVSIFLAFCMPKQHLAFELCHRDGFHINLDHQGIFNKYQNLETRAFLFLGSIRNVH